MSANEPKFTRRTVLGGAAAAGAGVLLGPVADAAARAPVLRRGSGAAGRVFGSWVGRVDGESGVIEAPARFALAGLQWARGAHGVRIELRTRARGGPWGRWGQASVTGHDADSKVGSAHAFGEPVWAGAADLIELRSSAAVDDVTVHFVARAAGGADSVAGDATAAAVRLAQPVLDAGPGQPPIIARSVWAQGRARPAGPANYGTIKLAFVHHTDNPNGYSRADVPALLLAIFDYHRFVRGFFDIAYNFIIDSFGSIWEARAGGIDEPVIGAHAGGYNAESTGVAVLGTFMSVVPPAASIRALERLLAWKLALHGIPSLGKVQVVVDPAAAFYTPFRPGAHVRLPRVAGHRDGDLTDCPGNAFYARLPAIRPRIAQLEGAPTVLTLAAASPTVAPGAALGLTGTLGMREGASIAGAPIEVQRLTHDRAVTVATAATAADGTWSATLPALERDVVLRALHPVAPAAASNVIGVGVAPVLTLTLVSQPPVRVTGTVLPAKRQVTLDVYRVVNGRRRPIQRRRIRTSGGRFNVRALIGAKPGSYVLVARAAAGDGTLAGASSPLNVTLP
jgi:N-acetylmuramoyl-L-alanine amidase-like protein